MADDMTIDVAPDILEDAFSEMQIDDEWSVRTDRSFEWWPHLLRQCVWALEPKVSEGIAVSCIRIQTDVLRGVPQSDKVLAILSLMNMDATLSAFTLLSDEQRVILTASVYAHPQNQPWTTILVENAAAIQAAEANAKVNIMAEAFENAGLGQPQCDASAHPASGIRADPDDMLEVLNEFYAPIGEKPSQFTDDDFKRAESMEHSPSVLTSAGQGGLTAELPFSGSQSGTESFLARVLGRKKSPRVETALFQASSDERHPALGSGCLFRLTLPTKDRDYTLVNELNLAESHDFVGANGVGAWCQSPSNLTHVTFVPSAMYVRGVVEQMMWNDAMRALWARRFLS